MLILKENAANSVPTPPVGKDTFFIDDSGTPSVKNSAGNVTTFPVVNASNAQVVFMNGSSLSGEAALTYDFNNNVLNLTGNLAATNVKTDNLLYANGTPWDLQDPGGANTQVQFNDDESFGGSAAFTFNKSSNAVTMSGNVTTGNLNGGNLVSANYFTGTLTTTSNAQPNITSVGTLTSLAVSGTVTAGNVYSNSGVIGASVLAGTLSTAAQPNITSVGALSSLTVTGNANAGNIGATAGIFSTIAGDLTTAAQPNITSVGTLSGLGINGNLVAGNITSNSGIISGNGAGLTNIPGGNITGNITGNISNANFAAFAAEVTDSSQPNITSVGTLVDLTVTGNTAAGNFNTAGKVVASSFESNVTTGTAPMVVVSTTKVANLNADLLDGYSTATAATANTVVIRDADGSFSANVVTANLSGNATTAGTVVTAAQPNITSVGTLSSLTVSGNAGANNFNATEFVTAGNVYANSGTVGATNLAGTLTTAAQPNITSVGTLSSLVVSGTANTGAMNPAGHVIPTVDETYDLGSETKRWRDLWISGNSIRIGNSRITSNATSLVLQNPNGGQVVVSGNSISSSTNIVNGTSNVDIPSANSNVNISVNGTANVLVVTSTGANVTGTLNATGNANVGNIGATAGVFTTVAGNLTTAAQPNVTSLGTLTGLGVNGNITAANITANTGVFTGNGSGLSAIAGGNVTGQVANALVAGTVYTAAQPNITSVGTLTGLDVNGNITAANITANTGVFTGNGSGLSAIAGANVTGTVSSATTAGTVTTAAQPNITSVGTLSSLSVTGNVSAGNVSGTLLTGTLATAAQPNITSVGTLSSLTVSGTATAGNLSTGGTLSVTGNANVGNIGAASGVFTSVSGNGSALSAITGANVTGQVGNALVSGTVYTAAQPNVTSVGTLTGLTMGGNVAMGNYWVTGLNSPVNANDAATKQYVDDVAQGLHTHDSCNAATTGTLATISGGTVTYNNGSSGVGATLTTTGSYTTIDGVTLQNGMRILVKNEANAAHNGIYDRTSSTVLTRSSDFDTPTEMAGGDFTFVNGGTLYDNTGWVMPDPVTTVGTTDVNWVQFSGAGTYTAGTGLTLTGTVFSVNASQTQITTVGTLGSLTVSGNASAGNLSTGGTLSVTGNANVGNIGAAAGVFTSVSGNGSALTALNASNISTGTLAQARLANSTLTLGNTTLTLGATTTTVAGLSSVTSTTFVGALTGAATTAGTVTTAAQPNITSVGTLSSLSVTGNGSFGNVSATTFTGALSGAATTAGTVTTAAQPNITSVGTLTGLGVNGNITAANITANTGVFTGNGSGLSALAGANVTGTVSSATTAGTVTTAAQPNITSVGTLTGLTLAANADITMSGTGSNINGVALVSATLFEGSGANLTNINASNVSSGTLAQARLANASLTLGSTTLTLGGTTTTVAGLSSVTSTTFVGALSGAATTAGTVTTAAQPNITSVGTLTGLTLANASTISVGSNTNVGTFTGNFSLSAGSRLNATYADLAEKYVADADYEPGTVLLFGGEHEVTLSNATDSHRVAGVVSTNPAYTMNNDCEGEHVVMLALQGRVPVKVHGPVAKGDLMVSGLDGYAAANNMARAGTILGKALNNFEGESGFIEIVVGKV